MNKQEVDKIMKETFDVFNQTVIQTEKFKHLPKLNESDYKLLHREFLTPTDIVIDCDLFEQEIVQFDRYFEQWGSLHTHLKRYGLSLVNQYGDLIKNDPINGSLYQYNLNNPNNPLFETDCIYPTPVMKLESLKPLRIFDKYWTRSNIFKWLDNAKFMPHIDTFVPSPWIRLWATTDPSSVKINYFDTEMKTCENIERGRVYIIDTSLVHDAHCTGDLNYQFFLSVDPLSFKLLQEHLLD